MRKQYLDEVDHDILRSLIQGESQESICSRYEGSHSFVSQRLKRMKRSLSCNTTYQLIALATVNYLELPD